MSVFLFQHKILSLAVALWADNNNVTTLSNYHSPEVCAKDNGVLRRRKVSEKCERKRTEVRCPMQNVTIQRSFTGSIKEIERRHYMF